MDETAACKHQVASYLKLLTEHRVQLVNEIKNIECILDNLLQSGYFTTEDKELVQRKQTRYDKVREILDIICNKGPEAAEYFVYVMYKAKDVYPELQDWIKIIEYQPPEHLVRKTILLTDAVCQYSEKLRHQLKRETKFITSYAQKEDILLDDTYTETLMERVNAVGETEGPISHLEDLFSDTGIINEDAEIVFITGDAGVGKTILLQRLQKLWSKGELCTGVKFFFKFRCRMFNIFEKEDKISLRDLLFKYNCYPDKDTDEIFSYIQQHPDSVLFTLDGFDEINADCDFSDIPVISSPFDLMHPVTLLLNLLHGNLLKNSRKLLTARTGTELPLRMVRKRVTLKGFTKDHLLQYLKKFFKNQPHQTLVLTQLEANPHLCSLCSVPLFCWIIFKCYEHLQSECNSQQMLDYVTLTDIYLLMLEVFLNRSFKTRLNKRNKSQSETFKAKKDSLMRLGKLAKEGIKSNNFIFSQEQITAAGISEEDLQLGFIKSVGHYDGCGNQSTYEFLHLTLQSFFTAFFLVVNERIRAKGIIKFFTGKIPHGGKSHPLNCSVSCKNSKRSSKEHLLEAREHFQLTVFFLCGLLSKTKLDVLSHLTCQISIQKKRAVLKSYLVGCVKTYTSNDFYQMQAVPRFKWLVRCIFEVHSKEVARLAAKRIHQDYIKFTYCNVYSADCSAITFILRGIQKTIGLELDNNNINDYGVRELIPCFSKLRIIGLNANQITDEGVQVLSEELKKYKIVQFLGLYKNQITDIGAQYISTLIDECPSLLKLAIGYNMITSEGGKRLAWAVQKSKTIKHLWMWGNQVGDLGAEAFAQALRNHPSLKKLSLAGNGISTEGSKYLAASLEDNRCLKTLWLTANKLDDEAMKWFGDVLKVNRSLQTLWLIENNITLTGVKHLIDALKINSTIQEICLKSNKISIEETKALIGEQRIVF
ncbi:nucleotide-binding oligomerization domain-containing protein 1-like isoform X1 [Chiloscyllium plagiosum]|uniref:nucleotide-binding oligomerization domain-containing protein 1-like isoform X1 n=1 Tax=Chiloscyllium plagiosum TaxID=36176 RepID=UPI001CB87809|nr:nucleotide-binding oligomerization domain-containing protein 1-like isoform X1 [Chiloscyllium plagiosum]